MTLGQAHVSAFAARRGEVPNTSGIRAHFPEWNVLQEDWAGRLILTFDVAKIAQTRAKRFDARRPG